MFSNTHLITLIIFIIITFILYFTRHYIRTSRPLRLGLKYGLLFMLIVPEVGFHAWSAYYGNWDIQYSLPLELCSISIIVSVFLLLTGSRLAYQFVFFAGIMGALMALVTPNLYYTFPHFRFIHFFVVHFGIILAGLYMTWIEGYRPTWRSIGIAMVLLNILLIVVLSINYVLNANYMFLMRKPDTVSLLDILGPHPYYLIVEEFVALIMFVIVYFIFYEIPRLFRKMK